ncbi:nucleotidyltransferase family protein [Maribacter sp. MMG018]|uniref:nucleotidyltransferase family protein n=1 Tax=Maribacter sp. MMG018 TaxID=2822688 RepID=UPI0024959F3E|nr:nucleotidyltransferase family protein [Maribacter sp. MMG018]
MAAGESRRMNGIKQLLPWKGKTLLEHTISTVKQSAGGISVAVLGGNASTIIDKIGFKALECDVIENPDWASGLGSSIAFGVRYILNLNIQIEGVLICLADQPLFTVNYYNKLIDEFNLGNNLIVASAYENKAGVPAIFHRSILKELCKLESDFGARNVLVKYKKEVLTLDAGNMVADIDTFEEYKTIYKQNHNKPLHD